MSRLAANVPDAFTTGQLARLDVDTGVMTWSNAGHPPPMLIRGATVFGADFTDVRWSDARITECGVGLRRRRVPVFPLAALPAIVLISVTLTFATNRYRAIAEGALVVLAAVAIDAGARWLHARRASGAAAAPGDGDDRAGERVLAGS